jgi:hypothetical protein
VLHEHARVESLSELSAFRDQFYDCLATRADALFELTDAALCTEGPVASLVELSLSPVFRRGHGALYDALADGELAPLRRTRGNAAWNGMERPEERDRVSQRNVARCRPRHAIPGRCAGKEGESPNASR